MVLVVSPGHPLAGAGQVELAMLRQLRFVSLQKSSTVQGIRNILQGHGVVWSTLQVVMVRRRPSLSSSLRCCGAALPRAWWQPSSLLTSEQPDGTAAGSD